MFTQKYELLGKLTSARADGLSIKSYTGTVFCRASFFMCFSCQYVRAQHKVIQAVGSFHHSRTPDLLKFSLCSKPSTYSSLRLHPCEQLALNTENRVWNHMALQSIWSNNERALQLLNLTIFSLLTLFPLCRQPVEIKLFTNRGICINAIDVLMKTVDCPVLEVVVEAVKAVAAFLR